MYVPGHKDILDSELADTCAKKYSPQVGPFARDNVAMDASRSAIRGGIKDPPSHYQLVKERYTKFFEECDMIISIFTDGQLLVQYIFHIHSNFWIIHYLRQSDVSI